MQTVVRRPKRLIGSVTPPGDKSISHRAAIFNAIATGTARIDNYGPGADCASTLRVLGSLGAQIDGTGSSFTIHGGALHESADVLDVGNSGTTIRLMSGVLATQPFHSVMTGDRSIRSRPMGRVIEPRRLMGAHLDGRHGGELAPLTIRGGPLHGIRYEMSAASAEVKTALLLAGLAAAVCHPDAEVRVIGVGTNPTRTGALDVLCAMGADVRVENERTEGGEPVADLVACSSELRQIDIEGDLIPRLIDEVPVLALAACFAKGTTTIRDAAELRVKESDRLRVTARELSRLGAWVEEMRDGLRIIGGRKLSGASCRTQADHRLAMTLGVAGSLASGATTVGSSESVSTSYPAFRQDLRALGGASTS